jgi:hypothetical protein
MLKWRFENYDILISSNPFMHPHIIHIKIISSYPLVFFLSFFIKAHLFILIHIFPKFFLSIGTPKIPNNYVPK